LYPSPRVTSYAGSYEANLSVHLRRVPEMELARPRSEANRSSG